MSNQLFQVILVIEGGIIAFCHLFGSFRNR